MLENITFAAILSTVYNETTGPFYVKTGDTTHGADPFIINNLTLTITLPEITTSTPTLYWRWMYWLEYRVVSANSSLTTWKSLPFPSPNNEKLVEKSVTEQRTSVGDYNANRVITINWSGKDYKTLPLSAGGFEIRVRIQPHGKTQDVAETESRDILSQIATWDDETTTTVCSVKNPYLSCITDYGNKQALYADASLGYPSRLVYKIQSHAEGADTLDPIWYFTGSKVQITSDDTDNIAKIETTFTDLLPQQLDDFYQTNVYIDQITDVLKVEDARTKLQVVNEQDTAVSMSLPTSNSTFFVNLKIQLKYGYKMGYGPADASVDIMIDSESLLDLGQLYYDYGYRPSWSEEKSALTYKEGGR